jgi:hypothetical protein
MREELQDLKQHIYEDGVISEDEVDLLKAAFARYGLGEEEVGLLLDLNTVLSGETHVAAFDQLVIDSVVAFMTAPGDLSLRMIWLQAKLFRDGTVDGLERKVLDACTAAGVALSPELKP